MFPTSRLGNINTLALPATGLPGALLAPTDATRAASACISPSIITSGAICLASSVAFTTLSTNSFLADPLVEKLNMATLGSILAIALAVPAVATAIWANSSAVGLGSTAQSAHTIRPFSPYSGLLVNNKNAPDTTDIPGKVFTICNAGRNTSPVAFFAPATSPSASPLLIIKVARYSGSRTSFKACSFVIPLLLRSSTKRSAYASFFS